MQCFSNLPEKFSGEIYAPVVYTDNFDKQLELWAKSKKKKKSLPHRAKLARMLQRLPNEHLFLNEGAMLLLTRSQEAIVLLMNCEGPFVRCRNKQSLLKIMSECRELVKELSSTLQSEKLSRQVGQLVLSKLKKIRGRALAWKFRNLIVALYEAITQESVADQGPDSELREEDGGSDLDGFFNRFKASS